MVYGDQTREYLKQFPERMPDWLASFSKNDSFDRIAFFSSRTVFYPGSGTDGQPIKLFSSTAFAHCFVYVDYGLTQEFLEEELSHPVRKFRGYSTYHRLQLNEHDLSPNAWIPHFSFNRHRCGHVVAKPYAFLEILQREDAYDSDHGPERFAVLFIFGDGIATYDALYCQKDSLSPPKVLVMIDHGFGGNWNRYDKGGVLHDIALKTHIYPDYFWVGLGSTVWDGYQLVQECKDDKIIGGMCRIPRKLYKSENNFT